jgi:siroheme synthase
VAIGHTADTPLLIVSNASLPTQIIRTGTLETAGELAADAQDTPSLIIIGEAAAQNASLLAVHRQPEAAYAS